MPVPEFIFYVTKKLFVQTFMEITGCDIEDAMADLLANMIHWADRNDQDFDLELSRARSHYYEELLEEQ